MLRRIGGVLAQRLRVRLRTWLALGSAMVAVGAACAGLASQGTRPSDLTLVPRTPSTAAPQPPVPATGGADATPRPATAAAPGGDEQSTAIPRPPGRPTGGQPAPASSPAPSQASGLGGTPSPAPSSPTPMFGRCAVSAGGQCMVPPGG